MVAGENQGIRTDLVKSKIDRSQENSSYKADESIIHASGCSKLSLKGNKRRHDNLGKIVHRKLNQEV